MLTEHWAAWLAIPIIQAIPLLWAKIRNNKELRRSIWIVLGLQQVVAITNFASGPIIGAKIDAVRFVREATWWADHGKWSFKVGSEFYVELLGLVFRYIQPSALLASEFSILASALFLVVMSYLIPQFTPPRYMTPLILLAGLWPTRLMLCSVPLREAYEILFFSLTVLVGLQARKKGAARWWLGFLVSCIAFAMFHQGLVLYMLFLIPCVAIWPQDRDKRGTFHKRKWIVLGLLVFLGAGSSYLIHTEDLTGAQSLQAVWQGEGLDYLKAYRQRLLDRHSGTADYGLQIDTEEALVFVKSIFNIYMHYLFSPFPWQVTRTVHWVGLFETLVRSILLFFSVTACVSDWRRGKRDASLLLVLYVSLTFLWALGTANFGTAIRHHLVTNWILVCLGGVGFINLFRWKTVPREGVS